MDNLSFFEYLSPFCFCQLNFIVLFPFLIKYYHILFNIIVFWWGCDRPSGHLSSCPFCFFPYSRLSYYLRLYLYLISFLLFPCASVWENTCAWVPPFPIAILNCTFFFCSMKAKNNWEMSAIKQILLLLLLYKPLPHHCLLLLDIPCPDDKSWFLSLVTRACQETVSCCFASLLALPPTCLPRRPQVALRKSALFLSSS